MFNENQMCSWNGGLMPVGAKKITISLSRTLDRYAHWSNLPHIKDTPVCDAAQSRVVAKYAKWCRREKFDVAHLPVLRLDGHSGATETVFLIMMSV